jgi:DNA helicase HerA-like ATPase
MTKSINTLQRQRILEMLAAGANREVIAVSVGVTPGQVSAVAAHKAMGSYTRRDSGPRVTKNSGILLGSSTETQHEVFWDPANAANPHLLILGESGFGKTYSISCILAELQRANLPSLVFDYGQGFDRESASASFLEFTSPLDIEAAKSGVQINPFEIFPFDLHGPTSVAHRIASTLARIYTNLGIQQHALIREAVIDVYKEAGIFAKLPSSWHKAAPTLDDLRCKLTEYSDDAARVDRKIAKTAASHISSLFLFDLFRDDGEPIRWSELISKTDGITVFQLRGIDQDLQRLLTEFLLWNFLAAIESAGPAPLRCFVVLDEAHRLISGSGTAVDKLLREGRKFGVGAILASQQPEDFDEVAFSNTATKLIFQISDRQGVVSKRLGRKLKALKQSQAMADSITTLPRGIALAIQENTGAVIKISSFEERDRRWRILPAGQPHLITNEEQK